MITAALGIGWIACGVGGYLLVRSNRRKNSYWMVNERNGVIACSFLLAPLVLVAGLVSYGEDVEASW